MAGAAQAAGSVIVSFTDPQRFDDVTDSWGSSDDNLAQLAAHLQDLGSRHLADGQNLQIEVLNVDLAGRLLPRHGVGQIRVITGRIDWPRITLRYTLLQAGQPVLSGEERISDMAYQMHDRPYSTETLRYEKRMLEEWFRQRIVQRQPAPS